MISAYFSWKIGSHLSTKAEWIPFRLVNLNQTDSVVLVQEYLLSFFSQSVRTLLTGNRELYSY